MKQHILFPELATYNVKHHRHITSPKEKGRYRRAERPRWHNEREYRIALQEKYRT